MKSNVIDWLEGFYLRFPPLDSSLKEFIVKVIPYLTILTGALLTIASVLEILGTPFLSVFTLQGKGLPLIQMLLITNVIGIAQGLLMIFAFAPLRHLQQKGWRLLFWSQILWMISSLLSFSPSLLIGVVLLYPLFQVKSYYR